MCVTQTQLISTEAAAVFHCQPAGLASYQALLCNPFCVTNLRTQHLPRWMGASNGASRQQFRYSCMATQTNQLLHLPLQPQDNRPTYLEPTPVKNRCWREREGQRQNKSSVDCWHDCKNADSTLHMGSRFGITLVHVDGNDVVFNTPRSTTPSCPKKTRIRQDFVAYKQMTSAAIQPAKLNWSQIYFLPRWTILQTKEWDVSIYSNQSASWTTFMAKEISRVNTEKTVTFDNPHGNISNNLNCWSSLRFIG